MFPPGVVDPQLRRVVCGKRLKTPFGGLVIDNPVP
jgi:hypothetical protein